MQLLGGIGAAIGMIARPRRRPKSPPVSLLDRVRYQNLLFTVLALPGLGLFALLGALFFVPAMIAYSPATRDAAALESSPVCTSEGDPNCRIDTPARVTAYEPTDGTSPTRVSLQVELGSAGQSQTASFQKGEPAFTKVGERVRVELWRSHVMWMTNPGGEMALSLDNPEFNKRQLLGGAAISAGLALLAGSNAIVWLVVGLRLRRATKLTPGQRTADRNEEERPQTDR
jgi:hypothetical protein